MAPDAIEKTAFVTPDGKYEYLRMSFGSPKTALVYLDDVTQYMNGLKN